MRFSNIVKSFLIAVFALTVLTSAVDAKEGYILQDEFAGLLFNRLEMVEKDTILTKQEKIKSLEELKFAPDKGYTIGEKLTVKQLVVILIRVYSLEKDLPADYTHEQAIDLLIDKGILKEEDKLEIYVLYIRAVDLITKIEPIPGQKPQLILLPRIPPGQPASPID